MRYRTWFGGPCVTFLPPTLPGFSTSGLRGQVWTVGICYNGLWTPLWRKVSWNMVGSIEAQWMLHFQLILTCRFDKTERLLGEQGLNQHWLLLKPNCLWNSDPVNIMSGLLRQRIWKINIYCWQQESSLKTISCSQNKQRSQISNRKKKWNKFFCFRTDHWNLLHLWRTWLWLDSFYDCTPLNKSEAEADWYRSISCSSFFCLRVVQYVLKIKNLESD